MWFAPLELVDLGGHNKNRDIGIGGPAFALDC
jgi:hypothetical protein